MRASARACESRGVGGGARRAYRRRDWYCRGGRGRGARRGWTPGPADRVRSPTGVPGAPSCRRRPGVTGT